MLILFVTSSHSLKTYNSAILVLACVGPSHQRLSSDQVTVKSSRWLQQMGVSCIEILAETVCGVEESGHNRYRGTHLPSDDDQ